MEEFSDHACKRAPRTGVVDRLLDYFIGPHQFEFYPTKNKRSYFEDSNLLRSIALADGSLFGSCVEAGCYNRCVPMLAFRPEEQSSGSEFDALCDAHNRAVSANDVDVAFEQRTRLEVLRSPTCVDCRSKRVEDLVASGDAFTLAQIEHKEEYRAAVGTEGTITEAGVKEDPSEKEEGEKKLAAENEHELQDDAQSL